jgi:ketosteroid isomerase-like protein
MSIQELNTQLNEMIMSGKALEAFEQFYAEDIVMQENLDEPCLGKEANRTREQEFFGSITEFHGAELHSSAADGEVSYAEMSFDATYKDGERRQMTEVAVRRWKGDKIVHERFYYSA